MSGSDIPLVLVLVAALITAVFLALAEASLLRISEIRARTMADEGAKPAVRLVTLLERLPQILNMILLLALLAQIGAATITGVLAQRWFGNLGVTVASVLLTVVLFVYGEAIPKTYAVRHAARTALMVSGPVSWLERLLRPLVALLVWFADIQMPGKGITTSPTVTEDELKLLAYRAAHEGEITEEDLDLIERAFKFGDRRADDIMVPRPDIVAIDAASTVQEALEVALATGHRRLPVYTDSLEHITGVVRLRDLISVRDDPEATLLDISSQPMVVPETKRISRLLDEMQDKESHLAIVVDEYGITAGLVTVEDVAEELLGTLTHQSETPELTEVHEGRWVAAGSMPVEDLAQLQVTVPEGDWNTVAGMMIGLAGRLLSEGDAVELDQLRLQVEKVRQRRITRISITRLDRADDLAD